MQRLLTLLTQPDDGGDDTADSTATRADRDGAEW
jgi:hypothetical protein